MKAYTYDRLVITCVEKGDNLSDITIRVGDCDQVRYGLGLVLCLRLQLSAPFRSASNVVYQRLQFIVVRPTRQALPMCLVWFSLVCGAAQAVHSGMCVDV